MSFITSRYYVTRTLPFHFCYFTSMMFFSDDNLLLKFVAWLLTPLFYIVAIFIKLFFLKGKNLPENVQVPQHPRIVVITGASQGIGEALVEYYHNNCSSCHTIVMISRNKDKLDAVKTRLNSGNQKQLVIYPCDVTDAAEMNRILLDIFRTHGQIDIIFANAGLSFRQQSLTNTFDKAVRTVFDTNINGVVNTVMPLIEVKGVRQIAIISSQVAYAPAMSPIYGASKQCVLSFGLDLRRLLAKDHIAVNVVSPGPIETPMLVGTFQNAQKHSISQNEAARLIAQGLRRNQAEIVFPTFTGIFIYGLSALPSAIAEPIIYYVFRNR